jgi:hypothetical protein
MIWWPSLRYGLVVDDAAWFKTHPYNVRKGRIFNLTLHVLVCEYIYIAFGCTPAAFMAAILFSVHPQAVQVPVYIGGRQYGLNSLMFLFSWTFAPAGCLILLLCRNGISPMIMFAPAMFLFTKHPWLVLCAPLLAWRTIKYLRHDIKGKVEGDGVDTEPLPKDFDLDKFTPKKFIIVAKTFWYYTFAALLPVKNGFYNSWLVTLGAAKKHSFYWYSFNRYFWGGLVLICTLLCTWAYNRTNPIGFGIMLFVLSIGPFLNFITVQQFTASRYAYLATAGFLVALVHVLTNIMPVNMVCCVVSGLFAFYLYQTVRVLRIYRVNDMTLMEIDSQEFPDNPRLWYFRAGHQLRNHNPVMAFAEGTYGLKHCPDDCQLYFGLACACHMLGKFKDAGAFLDMAEKHMITTERETMKELILDFRRKLVTDMMNRVNNERKNANR